MYFATWNRSIHQNSFQGTTRSTRGRNAGDVGVIPNRPQAGFTTGATSKPSITLKPDDVRRALECQLPPRKKDMKSLCTMETFFLI